MIICNNNSIDIIQGNISYGNAVEGITDWRLENTSSGVFNILNSISSTPNISIIDNGNVGIGTIPAPTSSKLEIIGDINISGNYRKNNRDIISDTSNYVLSTSNILSRNIENSRNKWTTSNMIYYNTPNFLPDIITSSPVATTTIIGQSDRLISFSYTTDNVSGVVGQTQYTFSTTETLICDILIIGGGGGGSAGGGGGGGYLYNTNITLLPNTYTVRIGNGGTGATLTTNGNQGANSSFIGGSLNYIAYGGGGGGGNTQIAPAHTTGQVGSYGGNGHDNTTTQTYTSTQGNIGGKAILGASGAGGGGGGASTNGGDAQYVTGLFADSGKTVQYNKGGQGGYGIANSITNSITYYAGGGTAGANTNFDTDTSTQIQPLGGGGIGARANNQNGGNGTNGLGGGGGGGDWERTAGTTGGSGIVIIRYRKNDRIISYNYTTETIANSGQTEYIFSPTKSIVCDILLVGGGGGGGSAGGSGGGGDVLEFNNINLDAGSYKILVGRGGISYGGTISTAESGKISSFISTEYPNKINLKAAGGGGGSAYGAWEYGWAYGWQLGSPLNNDYSTTYIDPITGVTKTTSGGGGGTRHQGTSGSIVLNGITYGGTGNGVSGYGGINIDNNEGTGGAGGGAAPPPLGNGGNSISGTSSYTGNGGKGISSYITGTLIEYGGGGAGGSLYGQTTSQGTASGGGGYQIWPTRFIPEDGKGGGGVMGVSGGNGIVIIKIINLANVGIGTAYPTSKLHLYDNTINETKLTIQNNFVYYISAATPTFTIGGPSTSGNITTTANSPDKFMIFTTAGVFHTFTVPADGINCDILMIGGGGGGGGYGNAGGAGACIVAINQTLPGGTCVVYVGTGGTININGNDSYITVGGIDRYRAKGGGGAVASYTQNGLDGGCGGSVYNSTLYTAVQLTGGQPVSTNVVNGSTNIGPTITSTYAVLGNAGGSSGENVRTGGGGIGGAGSSNSGGNGKYDVIINSYTYNFRNYFANGGNNFGVQDGTTGNYYIGGGGNYNNARALGGGGGAGVAAIVNTGAGGTYGGTAGGSGIIIIRYRTALLSSSSSIELIRGTQNDSNRDYKIGNYNGDFIVKSSINDTDTDYIKITGTTGAITNPTGTTTWTTTSDRRIKENIERASYEKCYESINKLELNRFNYINGFNTVNRDITQLGFIAQEVKEIFPKSVFENSYVNNNINISDLQSIDTTQINYTLYGAVKKLIEKVNNNVKRIKYLKNILNIDIDTTSTSNITSNLIMN